MLATDRSCTISGTTTDLARALRPTPYALRLSPAGSASGRVRVLHDRLRREAAQVERRHDEVGGGDDHGQGGSRDEIDAEAHERLTHDPGLKIGPVWTAARDPRRHLGLDRLDLVVQGITFPVHLHLSERAASSFCSLPTSSTRMTAMALAIREATVPEGMPRAFATSSRV